MNKKLIILICCILAAAFILGATGVINLSSAQVQKVEAGDRLIGMIVTTEPVWGQPVIKSGNIDFGPNEGVPAEQKEKTSSDRSIPAEYDFVFPGVEGVRLFNVDTPPFSDGHTQVDTSAADEEFSRISPGFHMAENTNNGIKTTEKEYSITGTINYVIQDEDVTFYTAPIYQTSEGGIYLGHSGGGYSYRKDHMHFSSGGTFSQSASQSSSENGETTTEKRSIHAKIQIVREPVKITLCQYNAARELIRTDEYLPEEMPREITPLRETVMVVVDTENKADDVSEKHTFQALSMENTYFYTLQYKGNGYCLEHYHELLWPDPYLTEDLSWKVEDDTLTVTGHGRMDNYNTSTPAPWHQEEYTRLVVEEGITYLGNNAFSSNDKLQEIQLPESLTELGSRVFQDDDGLTEITLPGAVQEIGTYAFARCSSLRKVTLPDSVKMINTCAFDGCSRLEYINLPASVRDFGMEVFRGCGNLKSTVAKGTEGEWHFRQYLLPYDYGDGTPVQVPVGNDSITWKVEGDTLFISGKGDMDNYMYRYRIEDPDGPHGANGTNAPWDKETFSRVVIGEGITSIGENTFQNRTGLHSVTLPKSLTAIGNNAFSYCPDLEEINLGSVKAIGERAFCGSSLKSIKLSPALERIEHMVFGSCSKLTEITVPDSVTFISSYAFAGCASLEKASLPASVKEMYYDIFQGCGNLKEIVVEKGSCAEQYCIENKLPYFCAN